MKNLEKFEIELNGIKDFMFYRKDKNDLSPLKEVFKNGGHYGNKKLISKGMIVLDLGAHIGSFTKYCNLVGATCLSFEPELENFKLLKLNCDNNDNLLYNKAVTSEKDEELTFYFNQNNPNDSYRFTKIQSPGRKGIISVKNMFVGTLLNIHFDFVKMDIEGSEFGMIDKGLIFDCDYLVIEYHFSKDKNMANFRRRLNILKKHFKEVKCHPYLQKPNYFKDDKFAFRFDEFIFCSNKI